MQLNNATLWKTFEKAAFYLLSSYSKLKGKLEIFSYLKVNLNKEAIQLHTPLLFKYIIISETYFCISLFVNIRVKIRVNRTITTMFSLPIFCFNDTTKFKISKLS